MSHGRRLQGLPWQWGPSTGLQALGHAGEMTRRASRAVETEASPEMLYLWICQLRRAPYSYDCLDNFGRRSPRPADPAMRALEVGQPVMTIFSLSDFTVNRSLTISMASGWPSLVFGAITVRYAIVPSAGGRTVLRADLFMPPLDGPLAALRRYLLAWGDLFMMRKQLRTLAALAEEDTADASNASRGISGVSLVSTCRGAGTS